MKDINNKVSSMILVTLLIMLALIIEIPWILLMFWISKWFAILVIFVGIFGYLIVKGASDYDKFEEI